MVQPDDAIFQESERLRVTLSSIGDGVVTTDNQGRVTFLNPVAEMLTGWTLDEAKGLPLTDIFEIVNEQTRLEVTNPVQRVLREGIIVGLANHTLLIAKDGVERPIDDSAAPIRDARGNVTGVVLVFRDVTERRQAEEALRRSEERFRLLVEGARDYAIIILDPQGYVESWNIGAQNIKGYEAHEIIGKHFSIFYPPEVAATGWPEQELAQATAQGRFEDEGWRLRKDGSTFWANVIITALRDASGKLIGFSKITRDLTQRRELERARFEAEMMADVNRRKDEFLAMLSHELRNPLSPVLNAVHLLDLSPDEPAVRRRACDIIARQVSHLTRLIDDLLEVSRINTGKIQLKREAIDLRTVVERAVESARAFSDQRRHQLTVALPDEPMPLEGDATRLEQVVVNLLMNAAKYTPEGGQIWLSLARQESEAVLRVRDTGIGMPADLLPVVFDLFTQGERPLDRTEGGLGVGLTIVKQVVTLHGGNVEAHSAGPGQGSEFVVRLPLPANISVVAPVQTASAAAQQGPTMRVLVVDDNQDAADTMAMLLRVLGHESRVAYNGPDALAAASAEPPDAVILDIGLPGMDGYEVARRLRADDRLKHVPLIAITGYGRDVDYQLSQAAGFDAHLLKPVDAGKLGQALARPLEQRRGN